MESVRCNKAHLHTTFMPCLLLEGFHSTDNVSILFLIKSIIVLGVFHFTDSHNTVSSIYNQVNLNGRLAVLTAPCIVFMSDGIKT